MAFFTPIQIKKYVSLEKMKELEDETNNVMRTGSEGEDRYYVVHCESRGTKNCNSNCLLHSTSSACSSVERGS